MYRIYSAFSVNKTALLAPFFPLMCIVSLLILYTFFCFLTNGFEDMFKPASGKYNSPAIALNFHTLILFGTARQSIFI